MAPLLFHACARPISCICVSWKPATLAPPSKRSRFVRLVSLRDGKSYTFRAPPSAICTHCCVSLHYATDESQGNQLSFRPYVATEVASSIPPSTSDVNGIRETLCRLPPPRDEHGFGFFRTGFRLFCRIWIGLGFEILASTGFGLRFTDFLDNFANMLENVEITHDHE